jgi:hypothetical protein
MLPDTHHGSWRGPNRLWLEGPTPERSDGTIDATATTLRYTWSFRGAPHHGELDLTGPAAALKCAWKDTFHAEKGMTLHGRFQDGELIAYCTYPAGDGPEWGWRIEISTRDPEHLVLRMFNVEPDSAPAPAVDLRGAR